MDFQKLPETPPDAPGQGPRLRRASGRQDFVIADRLRQRRSDPRAGRAAHGIGAMIVGFAFASNALFNFLVGLLVAKFLGPA